MNTTNTATLDANIRTLTAFNSLEHVQRHVADGGKAPSFRRGTPGELLAVALLAESHPLQPLATLWD